MVYYIFLYIYVLLKSFRPHYGPGVDSASNRNEYQEYLLGSKGGRCVGLTTLPLSCASTCWNLHGLSRPVMGLHMVTMVTLVPGVPWLPWLQKKHDY
jgi:hypothetical protein